MCVCDLKRERCGVLLLLSSRILAICSLILGSLNNLDTICIPKWHFQKPIVDLSDSKQHCGDKAELVTTLQLTYHNQPRMLSSLTAPTTPHELA